MVNRKGLSTLVSSVIMVVIALSIAGVVANWSSIFAKERAGGVVGQTENMIECSNADMLITKAEINCQNACSSSGSKIVNLVLRNTGDVALDVDKFYITNNNGSLFEFSLPQINHVSSGSIFSSFISANFTCSDIVNRLDRFEVLSINCPKNGRDSLASQDVTFINC